MPPKNVNLAVMQRVNAILAGDLNGPPPVSVR